MLRVVTGTEVLLKCPSIDATSEGMATRSVPPDLGDAEGRALAAAGDVEALAAADAEAGAADAEALDAAEGETDAGALGDAAAATDAGRLGDDEAAEGLGEAAVWVDDPQADSTAIPTPERAIPRTVRRESRRPASVSE